MTTRPRFFHLIARAQREIERSAESVFADLGISAAQSGLLFAIGDDEKPLLGALAERLDLVPSAITGLVDRMSRAGLVERTSDPDDKRAIRLALTTRGALARREAARRVGELNRLAFAGFETSQLIIAADVLETLIMALPDGVAAHNAALSNRSEIDV